MNVKFFDTKIEEFIGSLEKPVIARVLRTIDLLETFGNRLGPPHTKKIGSGLFELRVRAIQEIRIFYTFHKGEIIILHGFIKKSQRIPRKEVENALRKLKTLDR